MAEGAVIGVMSSEAAGRPHYGLGHYAASKSAVEDTLRAWRIEHPAVRFTTLVIGSTEGTEFANNFELEEMQEAFPIWAAQGNFPSWHMKAEEVATVCVELLATLLHHRTVGVDELVLRSPAPLVGTEDSVASALEAAGQARPDRPQVRVEGARSRRAARSRSSPMSAGELAPITRLTSPVSSTASRIDTTRLAVGDLGLAQRAVDPLAHRGLHPLAGGAHLRRPRQVGPQQGDEQRRLVLHALHHPAQGGHRALDRVAPAARPLGDQRRGARGEVGQHLDEHVVAGGEVLVRRRRRDPGPLGHGPHGDGLVPALGRQLPGGVEQTPPGRGLGGRQRAPRDGGRGHPTEPDQLRASLTTSRNGLLLSNDGSRGRPSTRSPMPLRCISFVPAAIDMTRPLR